MQINTNVKQLDSREYKLILNPTEFSGTGSDKVIIVGVLEKIINELNLTLKQSKEKPKQRTVWYLDTNEHDFYENNDFIVRIKEKEKDNGKFEYDTTFKVRTPGKDKTLRYDLDPKSPQEEFKVEEENKYEEDVISQLGSQFSLSTELEFKEDKYKSRFNDATCAHILSLFPKLKLDVLKDKTLSHVNGLKVIETSYELGELLFKDKAKAKIEFSIWCLADNSKKLAVAGPVIGEFDIDVPLKNPEIDNNDKENLSMDSSIMEIEDSL